MIVRLQDRGPNHESAPTYDVEIGGEFPEALRLGTKIYVRCGGSCSYTEVIVVELAFSQVRVDHR